MANSSTILTIPGLKKQAVPNTRSAQLMMSIVILENFIAISLLIVLFDISASWCFE
jgi:Kef-type K+ transport system membrane component KefB